MALGRGEMDTRVTSSEYALKELVSRVGPAIERWRLGQGAAVTVRAFEVLDIERILAVDETELYVVGVARAGSQRCALRLRPFRRGDDVLAERLTREAMALSKVTGPGMIVVQWAGTTAVDVDGDSFPCVATQTELVQGHSLTEWVSQHRPSLRSRYSAVAAIGAALEALHRARLVHRVLTADCVGVTLEGRFLLHDNPHVAALPPSLQRPKFEDDRPTPPLHALSGTEASPVRSIPSAIEVAPEVRAGQDATPFSDLWSFACLSWFVLTGRKVVADGESARFPGAFWARWRRVPAPVQTVLRRCLDPDPLARPQHAAEIQAAIDAWGPFGFRRRRRRILRRSLFISAVIAVVGLGLAYPEVVASVLARIRGGP